MTASAQKRLAELTSTSIENLNDTDLLWYAISWLERLQSEVNEPRIENQIIQHDPVNHPSHYISHPSGIECIQVTEHMTFNCGNAVKYIWRNGLKEGQPGIQDLQKAVWYLNREIERLGEKP